MKKDAYLPTTKTLSVLLTTSFVILNVVSFILGSYLSFNFANPLNDKQALLNLILIGGGVMVVVIFAVIVGGYISYQLSSSLHKLTNLVSQNGDKRLEDETMFGGSAEVVKLGETVKRTIIELKSSITMLKNRIERNNQQLEACLTINNHLINSLETEQLLEGLVKQIKKAITCNHVQIYMLDDAQVLQLKARFDETGLHTRFNQPQATYVVNQAFKTEIVVQHKDEKFSEIALPITLNEQVIGVIDIQQSKQDGFSHDDELLLRSVVNQTSNMLKNIALFASLKAELSKTKLSRKKKTDTSLPKFTILTGHNYHYHPSTSYRPNDDLIAQAHDLALQNNRPTNINWDQDKLTNQPATIVAPIKLSDKTIGTLQLHATNQQTVWNEEDLSIIEVVLDQAALAAENLRLFEETQERATLEQVIRNITDELRAASDLDTLLDTASYQLGHRLGVRHTIFELGTEFKKG